MAIVGIDLQRCNGCGICVLSCPADVLRLENTIKKAIVKYQEDCVVCCWCVVECPRDAVILTPVRTAPLFTSWG